MNTKQQWIGGWFRLWIVASAIWTLGVSAYVFYEYRQAATQKVALFGQDAPNAKEVRVVVPSDWSEETTRNLFDTQILPDLNVDVDKWPTEIRWPFDKNLDKRKSELLWLFALCGLAFPLFILVLGRAFKWVRDGFSETGQT